jgi:hypothetical protein
MIGDNVTNDFLDNLANHQYQKMNNEPMIKGDWRKATNKAIAANLIESLEKLLGGEAKHYICCDRTTEHEKIVIEYNHKNK